MKSATSAPARTHPSTPAPRRHEVRIIGGQWKRTKLPVPDKPGLRPTPDRVRETLFNWLGQDLTGWRCLDAFAGSGALGLEAASRGAAQVVMVEQEPTVVVQLQGLQARLQADRVQIMRADGLAVLKQQPAGSWHLIFLDPPFDAEFFDQAVHAAAQAVAPEGLVYLEAPRPWPDAVLRPMGLRVHRYLKAGQVHAHLLAPLSASMQAG
jgi:16S rRNA (guanine(966)-N(2))-methyltransferase RsmD